MTDRSNQTARSSRRVRAPARVDGARRQPIENDVLRIAREHARQPVTGRPFGAAFV